MNKILIALVAVLVSIFATNLSAKQMKYISVGAGQMEHGIDTLTTYKIAIGANMYILDNYMLLGYEASGDYGSSETSVFGIGVMAKMGGHIDKLGLDIYAHGSVSAIDYTTSSDTDFTSTALGYPYGLGMDWNYEWLLVNVAYSTGTLKDKHSLSDMDFTKTTISFGYSY